MFNINNFGWCQWIMLTLMALHFLCGAIYHGKPRANVNGFNSFINVVIEFAILYNGGFFR